MNGAAIIMAALLSWLVNQACITAATRDKIRKMQARREEKREEYLRQHGLDEWLKMIEGIRD